MRNMKDLGKMAVHYSTLQNLALLSSMAARYSTLPCVIAQGVEQKFTLWPLPTSSEPVCT